MISEVLYKLQTLGPNQAPQPMIEPALYSSLSFESLHTDHQIVCLFLHQSILVIKVCEANPTHAFEVEVALDS